MSEDIRPAAPLDRPRLRDAIEAVHRGLVLTKARLPSDIVAIMVMVAYDLKGEPDRLRGSQLDRPEVQQRDS